MGKCYCVSIVLKGQIGKLFVVEVVLAETAKEQRLSIDVMQTH